MQWWGGAGAVVRERWCSGVGTLVGRYLGGGRVVRSRWSGSANVVDRYSEDLHLVVRAQNALCE